MKGVDEAGEHGKGDDSPGFGRLKGIGGEEDKAGGAACPWGCKCWAFSSSVTKDRT